MKTTIHCDERITNIRNAIYCKAFWAIIIADLITGLLDDFFQTDLNYWVLALAPCILGIWMAAKGVLFNGTQHFPRWCWLVSLVYAGLNTICVFAMSFNIDTHFYLEEMDKRILSTTLFFIIYLLMALSFFYVIYRIALKKVNLLSADNE